MVAIVTRSRSVTWRGKTSSGREGLVSCGEGKGADPDARKMGALAGSSSMAGMVAFVYLIRLEKGLRGNLIAWLPTAACEAWKVGVLGRMKRVFTGTAGL